LRCQRPDPKLRKTASHSGCAILPSIKRRQPTAVAALLDHPPSFFLPLNLAVHYPLCIPRLGPARLSLPAGLLSRMGQNYSHPFLAAGLGTRMGAETAPLQVSRQLRRRPKSPFSSLTAHSSCPWSTHIMSPTRRPASKVAGPAHPSGKKSKANPVRVIKAEILVGSEAGPRSKWFRTTRTRSSFTTPFAPVYCR